MEERKVTKVFCKQACDICCDSDFYIISVPTHNEQLIKEYFSTTDLEIISMYKTVYYSDCEKSDFKDLMNDRRLRILEL